MSFMSELNRTLGNEFNQSRTENGALGYRTTQRPLLDMNFKVASYRKMNEVQIVNDFMKAYYEDKVMAMKWLFYVRDIRGGLGERRLFRVIFKHLAQTEFNFIRKLVPLMAEYGRYDDLMILFHTPLEGDMLTIIKTTLEADMAAMRNNQSVTLMGKWLPSENASSYKTKENALKVIGAIGITARQYRKMLSALRKHIGIIETMMSNKEWSAIDYSAVPSRANLIYNGAFLRNDETRRREFLGALEKGEVKINAATLYPHDIAHKYMDGGRYGYGGSRVSQRDAAIEGLWKALPDYVQGDESTIVVADGSGSMTSSVSGNIMALTVANALAIYFAERAKGQFQNKYITFSERPQLVNLNGGSLRDNLNIALQHSEVANTNVEAVFDLILQTAINGRMTQNELPRNVLVISDMEFDSCASTNGGRYNGVNARLFEVIDQKYRNAGYTLPRLVFWNVNSRTGTIPVKENDAGVALVSGFSPAVVKMVLSNKLDPYEAMVEILNSERYAPVGEALA